MFEFGRMARSRMRTETKLTLPQLEVLHFVHDTGSPAMQDIAHHLKVKAPTVTALIAEMVSLHLLARISHAHDRRKIHLALTARGTKMFEKSVIRRSRILTDMLTHLSERDRREFTRILHSIVSNNR